MMYQDNLCHNSSIFEIDAKMSLPKLQRAVTVKDAGPHASFSIEEIELPTYGDDEVLVRLSYSGICHTDVAFAYGGWDQLGFGMMGGNCTPGHEGVGHVVAVGSTVNNLKVGDRVGTKWLRSVCEHCNYCEVGNEHLCHERQVCGLASPGSLQQYITLRASTTPKIPDSLPLDKAGPLVCAGVTIFRAIKITNASSGDWIVISGAGGGLGHLGIQYANKMGMKVIGIDSGDKEDFCLSLGADHFIDFRTSINAPDEVHKITGGGAKGVLVPTGSRSSYEQAVKMLGPAGTLVCIGLPSDPFCLPLQIIDIITGGYTVTGVNASSLKEIQDTLDFSALHDITPITQLFPMKMAGEAFEMLKDGRAKGRVILDLQ
jgi:propanol-preferring alcohol dehydrogenase